MNDPRARGFCEPRFARVREAFESNLARGLDVGAACCVHHRGRVVVDLWGGLADPRAGRAWEEDTAVLVFSATKGATAIALGLLAERGALDFDDPVAASWPEFAANGKESVTVREVLSHRAGLPVIEGEFTLAEALAWTPVVEALAAQAPLWPPGSAHGYHVRSYGWLAGEILRRVDGRSAGRFFAAEVAGPLGLDFWIGLPVEVEPRVARILPPEPPSDPRVRELLDQVMGPGTISGRALSGPSGLFPYDGTWNRREVLAAELPSSNGVATARAVSRLYAAVIGEVDGIRLLSPGRLDDMRRLRSEGPDRILLLPTAFGTGFMLPPSLCLAAAPGSFGHPGAGGSLGYAEPESGLALGYAMNRMVVGASLDSRAQSLVEAARASL
ncbi:MAG: serine hydrolase domain-containing protein [Alphaproteobacteria bacterium]